MELENSRAHFFDHYQWGTDPKEIMTVSFDAGAKSAKEAILEILRETSPCCSCCSGDVDYRLMVEKIEAL